MSIWKGAETKEDKPWGQETSFNSPFGMGGKKITMSRGHRNSLKYYTMKNQLLYCLSGHVRVHAPTEQEFGNPCCDGTGNYFELSPGEYILIQSENPYRLEALTDCELLEVTAGPAGSSGEMVRLQDDYGRLGETADLYKPKNENKIK